MAFFSKEAHCVEAIQNVVSPKWRVSLGQKHESSDRALLVQDEDQNKAVLEFDRKSILGLNHPLFGDGTTFIEEYVVWGRLFKDIIQAEALSKMKAGVPEECEASKDMPLNTQSESEENLGQDLDADIISADASGGTS